MSNIDIALEHLLSPKIIPCVAGVWGSESYCLPIDIGAKVIQATGTRALVLHIPTHNDPSNESISFEDLIQELSIPLSNILLLFNTSNCSSLESVQRVIDQMKYIHIQYINELLLPSFLKLEILNSDLRPNDQVTLEIIQKLEPEIRNICIPFLRGEENSLVEVSTLGCPAARIWCSGIGTKSGITDKSRLEGLLNSTNLPLILEGGIATPQHVQEALTLGFSAVLINSAFRHSSNPVKLAKNLKAAVDNLN